MRIKNKINNEQLRIAEELHLQCTKDQMKN